MINNINYKYRYGCWGICFVYGTWFALSGLAAAGKSYENCSAIRKGVDFLLNSQREDGGWDSNSIYHYGGKVGYFGSRAITTAFALEAIDRAKALRKK